MRVFILDSTLRAGALSPDVSWNPEERLAVLHQLDDFGIDVIEVPLTVAAGFRFPLRHARLAVFGIADLALVPALLETATPVVTLLGESHDARVYRDLGLTGMQHLKHIRESIAALKAERREVIYDASNFFDAFEAAPEFALRTVEVAFEAGADVVTLCDTGGETLPGRLAAICRQVRTRFGGNLGIQAGNDGDVAVANTFAAVAEGFSWVQATVNGYGPRCGWANLCSVLPGLELKLGHSTVRRAHLEQLTALAHLVAGSASLPVPPGQPYVGRGAFSGIRYDDGIPCHHTRPEQVGNRRLTLVSDLMALAQQYSGAARLEDSVRRELHDRVAQLEAEGYEIEAATGTFELVAREAANPGLRPFEVIHYEVTTRQASALSPASSDASITLLAGHSVLSATSVGNGPVHALDLALRTCLGSRYPAISKARLIDYRVHVLDHDQGTAARVRVLVEWSDGAGTWTTMGIARNVVEASWRALADGLRLELMRLAGTGSAVAPHVEDYSWAV